MVWRRYEIQIQWNELHLEERLSDRTHDRCQVRCERRCSDLSAFNSCSEQECCSSWYKLGKKKPNESRSRQTARVLMRTGANNRECEAGRVCERLLFYHRFVFLWHTYWTIKPSLASSSHKCGVFPRCRTRQVFFFIVCSLEFTSSSDEVSLWPFLEFCKSRKHNSFGSFNA